MIFIYGKEVLEKNSNLTLIEGDIRDTKFLASSCKDHEILIFLLTFLSLF